MKVCAILLVSFYMFFCGGCALFSDKPTTVILQNVETMEFVDCVVDHWGTAQSYQDNDTCVEGYKSKGFVVWGTR